MARRADERSRIIYEAIDRSGGFYVNGIVPRSRSRTNVPFGIEDAKLEAKFLDDAEPGGSEAVGGPSRKGRVARIALQRDARSRGRDARRFHA